jgi:hypothetical protein
MDSKHRHELMHNELADWIGKLPEMIKQYRNQIIGVALVIVGLISWPMLNKWRQESDFAAESQVSDKIATAEMAKYMAMGSYAQPDPNADTASSLLVAANNLADEAKTAPNKNLSALALVKRGQALRTELLLKKEVVPQDIVIAQIKQAQESYQEALDKATLPTIRAMAQLGLGLCSEESGQLEQAKDMYKKIIGDATYTGTPFVAMAQRRIDNLDDNNAKYTFVETPKPMPEAAIPQIQMTPKPAAAQPAPQEPNTQTK